ncbi:hypothetical protein NE674_03495 [Extibacter muris]|uniref:hypothetical protein n=1 Tax=Extibacter muris TaxID=1796622 RepID=UPI001D086225|nr:hypothetical protein [Extibacter muris]MCB6201445.1 hypothetical protein [Extibacter muris]MCQ4662771.1 hypothetical protein [Extibacter muris]
MYSGRRREARWHLPPGFSPAVYYTNEGGMAVWHSLMFASAMAGQQLLQRAGIRHGDVISHNILVPDSGSLQLWISARPDGLPRPYT